MKQQMLIKKLADGSSRALARCGWALPPSPYSSFSSTTSSSSLSRCRHWCLSGSRAGPSPYPSSQSFFSQLRSIATWQSRSSSLEAYGRCAAPAAIATAAEATTVTPRLSLLPKLSSQCRLTSPTRSRWMSSSAAAVASGVDSHLAEVLRTEYDYEVQNYKPFPAVKRGPPAPFTLQDKPGANGIILRRSFGKEDIEVSIYVQPEDFMGGGEDDEINEEEEDMAPPPSPISFTVTVTKSMNGPKLEFQCSTDGEAVAVDFLSLQVADDVETKSIAYDGPDYNALDNNVKTAFEDYLKVRGIDGKLAAYVVESVRDKEQREYTRWLEQVRKFLLHGR
ncbi:hypothetical protein CBR_g21837 [Chara braunii]|uniref:Uncharacterized protein n=1 Tax=Chara braunii TaxID=69332 RepID=A0A388JUL2_CHABU|nr:hypothetical protein CBR_g21837 [Chara braunii]|eukprot:GBG61494.1 hypothetical protein CBR_g21837 [Chara braunii]